MRKIALIGNQNCGKTTLFNILTGLDQFVGNWPGVTIDKKEGYLRGDKNIIITDLPGIYSLSPYTSEEVITRNYIFEEKPDCIINLIDGSNLERNLFLTTQLLELGIPIVIAFNFYDVVQKNNEQIDINKLSSKLHSPVIPICALKNEGIDTLCDTVINITNSCNKPLPLHPFRGSVEHALAHIEEATVHSLDDGKQRWLSIKLFEKDPLVIKKLNITEEQLEHISKDIKLCEEETHIDSASIIATERFNYISNLLKTIYIKKKEDVLTVSDKIDRILTNKYLSLPIFGLIIFLIYYISITTVGTFLTDWVNDTLFGEWIIPYSSAFLEKINCAPFLSSLIVDGIITGVGSVLGFVPQMAVLFLLLSFLEECGYMSRIAFILDRIFRSFGLSGKSFIPIIIGSGCGVPAIMASRTIEDENDRKMTIITTTFMPCSAKLPIIALISGVFFRGSNFVAPTAYFVGIVSILLSGVILKKTKYFQGTPSPFVLELPQYHFPRVLTLLRTTGNKVLSFIKKATTVIMLSTVLIWFLSNFGFKGGHFAFLNSAEDINISLLSYIGRLLSPIFIPIGWVDWRLAVATLTGLVAKENLVSTLGVLYPTVPLEGNNEIWSSLTSSVTPLCAYSLLIFNLLCAPCFAAISAISKEMNNRKWTFFAIAYQCMFAYCVSLIIYRFGLLITLGTFNIYTAFAVVVALLIVYLLVRKNPYKHKEGL